ncbi:MAG: penicillin-binding transpeptidase domain-containing protein [Mycobacteriales bacterium]
MNRPIRRVVVAVVILLLALVGNLTYVQFVKAKALATDPANVRVLISDYSYQRGSIIADGTSVASSVKTSDRLTYLRRYSDGPTYAPVTGFDSLIYSTAGIERTENSTLTGNNDKLALRNLKSLLTGKQRRGGNVVLTVNRDAQEAAYRGLQGHNGAAVALNPRTGAILAMASTPSWDPNTLSSHDPQQIRTTYNRLIKDPADPLLDKAISATYPPGSIFKTVVAAAALSAGKTTPDTRIPAPDGYQLPGSSHVLHNFQGETCGNGQTDTLIHAYAISCNTAFAGLGVQLGEQALREQAKKLGLDTGSFTMPLNVARSTVGDISDAASLALSSIGQDNVQITPMQAAMMAAAVANDGTLMKPYLVKQTEASDLAVVNRTEPKVMSKAMTPAVARQVGTMMRAVVTDGTGRGAALTGIEVSGKTGTADNAPGKAAHAWFIGYAPGKDVAVAVFLANAAGSGNDVTSGGTAGPIASSVIKAVVNSKGTH